MIKETNTGVDHQPHNLHKQIAAFEKLLQHAMNKFSLDKLHHMLQNLQKAMKQESSPREPHTSISGFEHLTEKVEELSRMRQTDDVKHIRQYFKAFLQDVVYLKELKSYFDEQIYVVLYEYYYDPTDDMGVTADDADEKSSNSMSVADDVKETDFHLEVDGDAMSVDFRAGLVNLSKAVASMLALNKKWSQLIHDTSPNCVPDNAFDPDSKYEVQSYPDALQFEYVLRLVPDMFVKAYKSVELAKLWWGRARLTYSGAPLKRQTMTEWSRKEKELENHLVDITHDIAMYQETVFQQQHALADIVSRETHFTELSDQLDKLQDQKDATLQKHNALQQELETLQKQLTSASRRPSANKAEALKKTEAQRQHDLQMAAEELKLLHYRLNLVEQDYSLELEMRPHMIRFKADAEEKLLQLKESIAKKSREQKITEKKLVLLQTNCQKIKDVLGSLVTGRSLTMSTEDS